MDTSRTTLRYTVDLAAQVKIGDDVVRCAVRDVSLGGVFVRGPALATGTHVTLRFSSAHLAGLVVPCTARWHDHRGSGLQFDGIRAVDTFLLAKFIRASRVTGRVQAIGELGE